MCFLIYPPVPSAAGATVPSAAGVLAQLPAVRVALSTLLTDVELDPGVDLHVGLELVGLSEAAAAEPALVRLLPAVHQQVALVVLGRPELFPALVALVWLDSCVEQLVLFQL